MDDCVTYSNYTVTWGVLTEEILMTVRFFTQGWDLFSPCEGLVFHLWQRDYRRVYAEDMKAPWGAAQLGDLATAQHLHSICWVLRYPKDRLH
eukprot:Skav216946  [mRNA]  locus=scaffold3396:171429:171704:+ [translate_table: standard]